MSIRSLYLLDRVCVARQSVISSAWLGAMMLFCLLQTVCAESNWPRFRGPSGSGVAATGSFPTHFGPDSNVVWKATVPSGNGSPCIWEDRIFLTGSTDSQLITGCLDRKTGQLLWQREIEPKLLESKSNLGNLANSTPTTDGQVVCVYFGSFGLAGYDLEGAELWRKPLGIPVTQHGAGTSPVNAGNCVVLLCDQDVGSYLLAVDKQTGQTLWKTERSAFRRGFSTPLPYPIEQPEYVIATGTLRLMAYHLKDGSERWSVSGLPNEMVSSPTTDGKLIYVAGWTHGSGPAALTDYDALLAQSDADKDGRVARAEARSGPARQHFQYIDADKDGFISRDEWETIKSIFAQAQNVALAVRPDGLGDVTGSHVKWRFTRGLPYVPSPLVYEGRVYLIKDGGMLTCLNAKDGEPLFQEERIGAMGNYYSSPVAAEGKVLILSQRGEAVVVKASDHLEIITRNKLGEEVLATPAILDGALYLRTKSALYRFEE